MYYGVTLRQSNSVQLGCTICRHVLSPGMEMGDETKQNQIKFQCSGRYIHYNIVYTTTVLTFTDLKALCAHKWHDLQQSMSYLSVQADSVTLRVRE